MRTSFLLIAVLCLFITSVTKGQTSIFPYGSSWKYLDNGSNQVQPGQLRILLMHPGPQVPAIWVMAMAMKQQFLVWRQCID
jgi:hypothetical protein